MPSPDTTLCLDNLPRAGDFQRRQREYPGGGLQLQPRPAPAGQELQRGGGRRQQQHRLQPE